MKRRPVQSGQAFLEYLLLLLMVLIVLGGVIFKLNTAYSVYAKSLFVGPDSYLGCLIINGLIPDSDTEQEGLCPRPIFDPKKGTEKPYAAALGGGAGSEGGPGGRGGAGGRAREGRGRRTIGLGPRDGIGFNLSGRNGQPGKLPGNEKKTPEPYTGSTKFSSGSIAQQPPTALNGYGPGYVPYRGVLKDELDANKESSVPTTTRDFKGSRLVASEKPKLMRRAQAEDASFDFGIIFKYLIIAALVLAILFFIGSQIFAVSRGRRRG